MYYHSNTNKYIFTGTPFELNGVQYPSNWLQLSTKEDQAAIGLEEVTTVGERLDDRYHYINERLVGNKLIIENTPMPPEMVRSIKISHMPKLSPRQIRQALTRVGLRTSVEDIISSGSQDLKDWWEYSTELSRDSVEISTIFTLLQQSDQQIDELWELAATL